MITATKPKAYLSDCHEWREQLRHYREELNGLRNQLYIHAAGSGDHLFLREADHFHNQFHIQLINIHDLKHSIKEHLHQVEHHPNFGHKVPHQSLGLSYQLLTSDLEKLKNDFDKFVSFKKAN